MNVPPASSAALRLAWACAMVASIEGGTPLSHTPCSLASTSSAAVVVLQALELECWRAEAGAGAVIRGVIKAWPTAASRARIRSTRMGPVRGGADGDRCMAWGRGWLGWLTLLLGVGFWN